MTCENCKLTQKAGWGTYISIGEGEIFVVACDYHIRQLSEIIRKGSE